MTNQPVYIAIALLCLEIPSILFSPLIGYMIDKNIKLITYVSFLSRAIVFFIIPIALYYGDIYTVFFYYVFPARFHQLMIYYLTFYYLKSLRKTS